MTALDIAASRKNSLLKGLAAQVRGRRGSLYIGRRGWPAWAGRAPCRAGVPGLDGPGLKPWLRTGAQCSRQRLSRLGVCTAAPRHSVTVVARPAGAGRDERAVEPGERGRAVRAARGGCARGGCARGGCARGAAAGARPGGSCEGGGRAGGGGGGARGEKGELEKGEVSAGRQLKGGLFEARERPQQKGLGLAWRCGAWVPRYVVAYGWRGPCT